MKMTLTLIFLDKYSNLEEEFKVPFPNVGERDLGIGVKSLYSCKPQKNIKLLAVIVE
jgi:hypothetical protein